MNTITSGKFIAGVVVGVAAVMAMQALAARKAAAARPS